MSEQKEINVKMIGEHQEALFANNFQIYPPITPELTIEFNEIAVKETWLANKSDENGEKHLVLKPVVSLQLSQSVCLDLLKNLANIYGFELSQKQAVQPEIVEEGE